MWSQWVKPTWTSLLLGFRLSVQLLEGLFRPRLQTWVVWERVAAVGGGLFLWLWALTSRSCREFLSDIYKQLVSPQVFHVMSHTFLRLSWQLMHLVFISFHLNLLNNVWESNVPAPIWTWTRWLSASCWDKAGHFKKDHICIASRPHWVSSCQKRLYKAVCFPSADRPDDHSERQDAVKNYRAEVWTEQPSGEPVRFFHVPVSLKWWLTSCRLEKH